MSNPFKFERDKQSKADLEAEVARPEPSPTPIPRSNKAMNKAQGSQLDELDKEEREKEKK